MEQRAFFSFALPAAARYPSTMKHRVYVHADKPYPRCLGEILVEAPSESEAIALVFAGEGLAPFRPLDADTSYRLKCGDASGSSFGDEFDGTASATGSGTQGLPLGGGLSRDMVRKLAESIMRKTIDDALAGVSPKSLRDEWPDCGLEDEDEEEEPADPAGNYSDWLAKQPQHVRDAIAGPPPPKPTRICATCGGRGCYVCSATHVPKPPAPELFLDPRTRKVADSMQHKMDALGYSDPYGRPYRRQERSIVEEIRVPSDAQVGGIGKGGPWSIDLPAGPSVSGSFTPLDPTKPITIEGDMELTFCDPELARKYLDGHTKRIGLDRSDMPAEVIEWQRDADGAVRLIARDSYGDGHSVQAQTEDEAVRLMREVLHRAEVDGQPATE